MLLQAHRACLLKVRIGPNSPLFGPLLKTTCGPDEVCLSDSVPEAGERYPRRQLEIELETVRAPRMQITRDLARLSFVGASTWYLADNRQRVGRIPFSATVDIRLKMVSGGAGGIGW